MLKALKIRLDGMATNTVDSTLGDRVASLELRLQEFQNDNEDDHTKIW
jgi:hypothetical protein